MFGQELFLPNGPIVQLGERLCRTQEVEGSSPSGSTKLWKKCGKITAIGENGQILTKMDKNKIGQIGEEIAVKFLKKKGYQILDRNFEYRLANGKKFGEIDIIAREDKEIVFVEVKSEDISFLKFFDPSERINFFKIQRIQRIGEIWLSKNKFENFPARIDVLSIFLDFRQKKAKILHFKNI